MIDEDWRGFGSAFAESVRPEDPRGRTGRRMLLISLSTVVAVALGTLVYGALGGPAVALPSEVVALAPSSAAAPYQAGGQSPGQTWTAVAGPSCAASVDGTTGFAVYGYYPGSSGDQTGGWSTSTSGGYNGENCAGGFISVPVSGNAKAFDANRFALWSFDFSAKFTDASCRISTYVPVNSSRSFVGGDPAYFYYYGSDYQLGSSAPASRDGYMVRQTKNQGHWVDTKAFTVSSGKVTVKMVDAGLKTGSGASDVHAAAAQVRLTCTST